MSKNDIRIGIIGCGSFALYALQFFQDVPGVELIAVAGKVGKSIFPLKMKLNINKVPDYESLLKMDNINFIYIGSPPYIHHEQAMQALKAGKHVMVEKPFAITEEQANELIVTAKEKGLLVVANLMQRYNPLYSFVKKVIDQKILGEVIHGYFENYASDELLNQNHWFWDKSLSGGIFIEHSVHFFDLFEGWLGKGTVLTAQKIKRPNTEIIDQVHCTTQYGDSIIINQFHGFQQPNKLDRQELRLLFERGDVTLYEWIPVMAKINGIASKKELEDLKEIFQGADIRFIEKYTGKNRICRGRNNSYEVDALFSMDYGSKKEKWKCYEKLLKDIMTDQIAWIRDKSHVRKVTQENGYNSLKMALIADKLSGG